MEEFACPCLRAPSLVFRGLVSPCQSVSTCKTWDCSLKVLSGWLSSPIPDSLYPSSGQSKIVLWSVRICLVRSEESIGRGSDARLDGPVAAWGEYKASTMWMIREKLAAQLMPTVLPPMKVLPLPSQGYAAVTQNQYKVTTDNSKSISSATSARGFSKPTSGTNNVDLTTCSEVQFELRDGVPGVCYQDTENTAGWTSVFGRRRKRPQVPSYVLCRFPPDHPLRRNQSKPQL